MLDIISIGKNTQLHSFPSLSTKYTYSHVLNDEADFQIFPATNLFLEVNKKSGFELLRSHIRDDQEIIQRVKKRKIDDLCFGAVSKIGIDEIALGFTTGNIKFYDVKSGQFGETIKTDKIGNSVYFMDYSVGDEYLAALYYNSAINVYGLKTGPIKLETYRPEKDACIIRFNPIKKLHLAIGAYHGDVCVLDIQTKRYIFKDSSSHNGICRDLCISPVCSDILLTVGYDCILNVFDVRRKHVIQHIKEEYPLSAICISNCGTYCCVGNLKGDVLTYDFRNLNSPLDMKRIHDGTVFRVGFLPAVTDEKNIITNSSLINRYSLRPSISSVDMQTVDSNNKNDKNEPKHRDSFIDFLDFFSTNVNKGRDSLPIEPNRDSFYDLQFPTKPNDISLSFTPETLRNSISSDIQCNASRKPELRLKRQSNADRRITRLEHISDCESLTDDVFENTRNIMDKKNTDVSRPELPPAPPPVIKTELDIVTDKSKSTGLLETPLSTATTLNYGNYGTKLSRNPRKILSIENNTNDNNSDNNNNNVLNEINEFDEGSSQFTISNILKDTSINTTILNASPMKNDNNTDLNKISVDNNNNNNSNLSHKNVNLFSNFRNDFNSSTPNSQKSLENKIDLNDDVDADNNIIVNKDNNNANTNGTELKQICVQFNRMLRDHENRINERLENVERDICEKIIRAENEIKFNMDRYYHDTYSYAFKFFRSHEDHHEHLFAHLNNEVIVAHNLALQAENERLKNQIKKQ